MHSVFTRIFILILTMMSCIPTHPHTHNSAGSMGYQTKYSSNIQANNSNKKLLILFFSRFVVWEHLRLFKLQTVRVFFLKLHNNEGWEKRAALFSARQVGGKMAAIMVIKKTKKVHFCKIKSPSYSQMGRKSSRTSVGRLNNLAFCQSPCFLQANVEILASTCC